MEKLLSQEEVDALLKGVSDGEIETEARVEEDAGQGVKAYDFNSQDRIIRGRMPTMEIINDRFSRDATASLFRFMGRMAEVSAESFELIKYGEFIKKLPVPSSLNLFRMEPLRGSSVFFFDAKFIFLLVDILFGGPGRSRMKVEGRDFTTIEYRIIRKLLDMFLKDLESAWCLLEEMHFKYLRSELNPQFANIVAPTDIVLATVFQVELEWDQAYMGYCVPYSTVEPIKDRLYGRFQTEYVEIDQTWRQRIAEHLKCMEVGVSVELGTTEMTLRQLLDLKVGDVLRLNVGPDDPMSMKVHDVHKAACSAGQRGGSYAVEVISTGRQLNKEIERGAATATRRIRNPGDARLDRGLVPAEPGHAA